MDLAMLSLVNLGVLSSTTTADSALQRLNKDNGVTPMLACPAGFCAQNQNGRCDGFCVVNMDNMAMYEGYVGTCIRENGVIIPPSIYDEVYSKQEEHLVEVIDKLVTKLDPDRAAVWHLIGGVGNCHIQFAPYQELFAKRVILPRTSALAYWGVGVGKTAGAAAVLLQAGNAVRPGPGRNVIQEGQLPVHIMSVSTDFGDESMRAATEFANRPRDYYAISGQMKRQGYWRFECTDYATGIWEPKELINSLVIMNEAHLMSDNAYNAIKTANRIQVSGEFPPIVAALSGTPCAGGLRRFLQLMDLLDNSNARKNDNQNRRQTRHNLVGIPMIDLVQAMGLTIYAGGRKGQRVVVPVRPGSLVSIDENHIAATQTDDIGLLSKTTGLFQITNASDVLALAGCVVDLKTDDQGAVLLKVLLDEDDVEDSEKISEIPGKHVWVPSLLATLEASSGVTGAVCVQYNTKSGDTQLVSADGPGTVDAEGNIAAFRALSLVHTSTLSSAKEDQFESILLKDYNVLGRTSYVSLIDTLTFPVPVYVAYRIRGGTVPSSVVPGVPNVMAVIQNPGLVISDERSRHAWEVLATLDREYVPEGKSSHPFTQPQSLHRVNYNEAFYVALLVHKAGELNYDRISFPQPDLLRAKGGVVHDKALERWGGLFQQLATATKSEYTCVDLVRGIMSPKMTQLMKLVQDSNVNDTKETLLIYAQYSEALALVAIMDNQSSDPKITVDTRVMVRDKDSGATKVYPDRGIDHNSNVVKYVVIVSDFAGADEVDQFNPVDVNVKEWTRSRDMIFYAVPPTRQRMIQAEGRIRRNKCDKADMDGSRHFSRYHLLCGGHDRNKEMKRNIEARATFMTLAHLPDIDGEIRTSAKRLKGSAWSNIISGSDSSDSSDAKLLSGDIASKSPGSFDDIAFAGFTECADAGLYMELQSDISSFEVFYESLAQQIDMNRSSGDDLVGGKNTVTWTAFATCHDAPTMLKACTLYLQTIQPQPVRLVKRNRSSGAPREHEGTTERIFRRVKRREPEYEYGG